jgi:hypothetical protein
MRFIRRNPAAAPADHWQLLRGTLSGKPMFVRLNRGVVAIVGRPGHGIQVGLAVPLRDPRPDGLPSNADFDVLTEIEDAILPLAAERADLVAVVTTGGMREFVRPGAGRRFLRRARPASNPRRAQSVARGVTKRITIPSTRRPNE